MVFILLKKKQPINFHGAKKFLNILNIIEYLFLSWCRLIPRQTMF